MKTIYRFLSYATLLWLCTLSTANAALLGLVPDGVPDAKTWNSIDYTANGSGGFDMVIGGFVTALDDGVGLSNPLGACSGLACYTLNASFDGSGNLLSGGTIKMVGFSCKLMDRILI